jgi:hypothetical protein
MAEDNNSGREKDMEASWRGAEAYHMLILSQRQLYQGYIDASMKTVS